MVSIVRIFLNGEDNHIEKVEIPKGIQYQIINKTKGSIGQAYNYPELVTEVPADNL